VVTNSSLMVKNESLVVKNNSVVGRLVVVGVVVAFLSGCVTDPYTGQRKASKAAIGSIAGAILGAAVSSKEDRKKGALLGALAGGGAGLYMDNQERKLRNKLQGTGVSVTREGDAIRLNMPGNLTFATNSSDIQSNFYSVLNSVADVFQEFGDTSVKVTGHTDSRGSENYNLQLSQKRAESVANYLVSQSISGNRIRSEGWGESSPVATNETASGREQNRRVEIQIIPKGA